MKRRYQFELECKRIEGDFVREVNGEFGIGFFKRISRIAKGAARGVRDVGKAVVKSPLTKVVTTGLAVVYPPVGVPLAAAVAVADKAISAADSADKAVSTVAKRLIKNTKALASTGDPGAKRAWAVMKHQFKVKVEKAKDPSGSMAKSFAREQKARAALKAGNALAKAPRYGGFIVTTKGKVIHGKEIAKLK